MKQLRRVCKRVKYEIRYFLMKLDWFEKKITLGATWENDVYGFQRIPIETSNEVMVIPQPLSPSNNKTSEAENNIFVGPRAKPLMPYNDAIPTHFQFVLSP